MSEESAPEPKQCLKHCSVVVFYQESIVHHKYAPRGHTVNKEYYLKVLKRLCDTVRRKQSDLWRSGGSTTCPIISSYPAILGQTYASYYVNSPLKGRRFENVLVEDTKCKEMNHLLAIAKSVFKVCLRSARTAGRRL